jgi:hypothetical protein
MTDDGERRIRPALWVIFGALVVPVGLLLALDAAATATRVGGVEGAPRCDLRKRRFAQRFPVVPW